MIYSNDKVAVFFIGKHHTLHVIAPRICFGSIIRHFVTVHVINDSQLIRLVANRRYFIDRVCSW